MTNPELSDGVAWVWELFCGFMPSPVTLLDFDILVKLKREYIEWLARHEALANTQNAT